MTPSATNYTGEGLLIFFTLPIPEPATFSLLALGGLGHCPGGPAGRAAAVRADHGQDGRAARGGGGLARGGRIMTIRKDRAALLAVVLGFMLAGGELSSPCDASFVPIVNVDPSTQGQNVYHWGGMVGWTFSVQQAVIVKQVGFYDEVRDGLSRPFQIGLWQDLTGHYFDSSDTITKLLGTPTGGIKIPAGTGASLNGVRRVVDLAAPLTLQPGDYEVCKHRYLNYDRSYQGRRRRSMAPSSSGRF